MKKPQNYTHLVNRCKKLLGCEEARISETHNKIFLIIGKWRNTKDDNSWHYVNGERKDFDYLEEKVVASGKNKRELYASAKEHKRLLTMSMSEYMREFHGIEMPEEIESLDNYGNIQLFDKP